MFSKSGLIARAYDLSYPPLELLELEGERCVVSGQELTEGYRVGDVISATTNDFWTFGGLHDGYMSVDTARCFLASNPRKCMVCSKSIAVFGEAGYEPLINDVAAREQGRPWWAQLVRDVWREHRSEPCVVILTTDAKTRLWHQPHVRAGVLGSWTPVTVYDPSWPINETVEVDWPEMLSDLGLVEQVLGAGFWSSTLKTCLLVQKKDVEGVSLAQVWEWEDALRIIRQKGHWPIVQLVARKLEGN